METIAIEQEETEVLPLTMCLEELCFELGIGLTKGYELAKQDALPIPGIKIGREYRFSRRALDKLMGAGHDTIDAA